MTFILKSKGNTVKQKEIVIAVSSVGKYEKHKQINIKQHILIELTNKQIKIK